MNRMNKIHHVLSAIIVLSMSGFGSVADAQELPRLQRTGAATQMIVDGKPFLMLGGELHNSSASSAAYMVHIWDAVTKLPVNTVIGTASWELVEPAPGLFNFDLVDDQIAQARKNGTKLVLIWFGAYKNAQSRYAPGWVKADLKTYPRVERAASDKFKTFFYAENDTIELSPFSAKLMEADARAFRALMTHIAQVDKDHTVIAMQVQNEVGLLGDSRDRSPLASAEWKSAVPAALMNYLQTNRSKLRPELIAIWARHHYRAKGTWSEVFGDDVDAEEVFMAWYFGRYVGTVAAAGKKALNLPMFANAWLGPQPGQEYAGKYPSGGPVGRMMDVWKAAAPAIDMLSPDVYVDDAEGTFADYTRADNPLFSPELTPVMGNIFVFIGEHKSLGYSIFGIEDVPAGRQISNTYATLLSMTDVITKAQAEDRIRGFALKPDGSRTFRFGDYDLTVSGTADAMKKLLLDAGVAAPADTRQSVPEGRGLLGPTMTDLRPSGMIIQTKPDEFLLVGSGFSIRPADVRKGGTGPELLSVEEGQFKDGLWVPGRRLNGDELYSILPNDRIGIVKVVYHHPK